MSLPTLSTKRRLIVTLLLVSFLVFALIVRLGIIQVVQGEELKKQALEQWTRGIPVKAERGLILDRNGKKLAISISRDTVWCRPIDIKKPEEDAKKIAEILQLDEDEVYKKITSKQSLIKIKQWVEKEESEALRKANIKGIEIAEDKKRYYPFGSFAAHIIGHNNIDQVGQYGIEAAYNKYLTGTAGKWVKTTDAAGRQLPYDNEKLYEAKNGLNVVLTMDETIQHFAEKAALEVLVKHKAKNVAILVMEPKTGDILAMANKPDYDPNNPTQPTSEEEAKAWEGLVQEELTKKWFDKWRNFSINDVYEPGSTFKIITAAVGLEENVVTPNSQFYCSGYVRQVKSGKPIKCWRYYNPHGSQNFVEGIQNSCNVVVVDVGLRLGAEKMYEYLRAFGFGELTGVPFTGESPGIIPSGPSAIKDVNLATISFGQGIAVTPIQLVTAISAVANGGNLMVPRLVKELVDEEGNVVHEYKPEVKRKVISEETSKTMLKILESVVSEGTGKNAYVPGYRVGGKTGTAQKVIDGRYADGKYIASFVAVAPSNAPQIVVAVIVDEPSAGGYYGGQIAAPVAGQVVKDILNYLDVEPQFTEDEKEDNEKENVTVPDVRNKNIKEASRLILSLGLKYTTDAYFIEEGSVILDQFPLPGSVVKRGSSIDLYIESKRQDIEKIVVPDLTGATREQVIEVLNQLNLRFEFSGSGVVVGQMPKAGTEVDLNSLVNVRFDNVN
ncbi:stage V sporulation protein D (sporulation-specific penicillin-binding protein) [Proteiniborus sp. DW1]|uniref:stage V sporulation protein D n=1 Tax=Proteiniborus sp. DW1 TaxID=1889883 RepID=UPI00092DEC88|nr:stage V sporulation protein D [Proteiniborus sp. DW1]SCG83205.1 stage V sporulation protein D (sporulation-specific penicillin-binding protein) [Proteiniborus sp. DW1]